MIMTGEVEWQLKRKRSEQFKNIFKIQHTRLGVILDLRH